MASEAAQVTIAVWDVPFTAAAGERFTVKAGAKSSADIDLRGRRVDICDGAGAVVASGEFGAPWPGTQALHWTELTLPAPAQHGIAALSVRVAAHGLTPPHRDASSGFAITVVPAPEHTLTIRLVEKESGRPIAEADIRVGPHRARTAASGQAELRLAKGRHDLQVWKVGYDAPPQSITIDGDVVVEVAAVIVPEENADRAWKM